MAVSLVDLLRRSAAVVPTARAVSQPGGVSITYRALESASAALAAKLRSRRGDRVGVLAPKSVDTVVALWAAMRTGAAYVPLDPGAPAARVAHIARDCGMTSLLASASMSDSVAAIRAALPDIQVVSLDGAAQEADDPVGGRRLAQSPVNVRDLAYILYTSGSTGVPKGVMVSHGAALGFVDWVMETLDLRHTDVLSNHAPFHFDLSVLDLYGAAAAGAEVVVLDEEIVRFPLLSADALEQSRITVWYSVPGALRRMMRTGALSGKNLSALRAVLFAGEVYPVDELHALQAALSPSVRLMNLYGPTETNVCTFWEVPPAGTWREESPPIGVDCSSCEGVVVDEDLRPVPEGEKGELLIRGATLMTGYWGDAERTQRSFVRDFVYPQLGDLFYRTGDLVSRDPRGWYKFHGRRDHMVKVRGYRIELGEIESALHAIDGVREAAVVAVQREQRGGGEETELVAFVALTGQRDDDGDRVIHAELARTLPKYMVPAEIRRVDALPQTSSGKVDRQSLLTIARLPSKQGEGNG
jgi:amino acid adenylation domain-containing protein